MKSIADGQCKDPWAGRKKVDLFQKQKHDPCGQSRVSKEEGSANEAKEEAGLYLKFSGKLWEVQTRECHESRKITLVTVWRLDLEESKGESREPLAVTYLRHGRDVAWP